MASNSTPDSGTSAENLLSLSIFSKFIRNQHQQTTPTQVNPLSLFGGQEPMASLIRTTDTKTECHSTENQQDHKGMEAVTVTEWRDSSRQGPSWGRRTSEWLGSTQRQGRLWL